MSNNNINIEPVIKETLGNMLMDNIRLAAVNKDLEDRLKAMQLVVDQLKSQQRQQSNEDV